MDPDVLRELGLSPEKPEVVSLPGFGLRIGEKATLVPSETEESFGTVFYLRNNELEKLYSDAGVSEYEATQVKVITENGTSKNAICYLLPESKLTGTNPKYARELSLVCKKMGLPQHYIAYVESLI